MMRGKGAAGLVGAGMLLIGAAPGQAQELADGRYLGDYKGGTVRLKVSPDGTRLAEFQVINRYGRGSARAEPSAPFGTSPGPGLPIENHAFAGALSPYLSVNGSFTAPGVASGSFDLSPPSGRGGRARSPAPATRWPGPLLATQPHRS